ncbi:flagellin [Bosea caraganae]|uniref:Flagellin n=1 Tax=Bosea caraganae TaxID=2763117 RepID=A0A370LBL3_9HYPH|nr:flagellin [Bosea caraganae]RDJ27222.1 flagellin [Bosea caraganae]RDJ29239.1 flagellin [Bosea caraganae]
MAVSLSAGVRNSLASVQDITAQAAAVQSRLATGKRVNTAVDNPVNYFTASSLNNRSDQLKGLLDGMSNGIQTIQAASKGIDGVTKLVSSLQSTVKQAQADAAQNRPTKAGDALATTAEKIATSKSLKDIALDKLLVDDDADATNNAATETSSGNVGVATGAVSLAISIEVGDPAAGGSTFEASFDAENATVRDLVNEINKSGIATAFVDEKGQLNVKGTGSETVKFGLGSGADGDAAITDAQDGTSNVEIGFDVVDRTTTGIVGEAITSSTRSNLIEQYNTLRTQIDELAKDSGFNGVNLLAGDQVSLIFNEKTGTNQNKLSIQGTTLNSDNLGITEATNTTIDGFTNFQNDLDLEKATEQLNGALTSLKSLSSTFGANLAVANTRQDFTKGMADVLTTGASNLVNADANEEAANLLSLQTRQQLSQTALSLSSQADQAVLRLF